MASQMPPESGQLVGRQLGAYVLEELIGVGGMAEVYRAWDLTLERQVAVKVLPAALAANLGYVERFRREAQRVGALQNPHIVPVYAFGERPLLYLVMPILSESLRQRIRRMGRLPVAESISIVGQVATALIAAHRQGLVHRDVKPENILLDDEGTALLSDFGIARQVQTDEAGTQTISESGLPVGTPVYMAPEQLRNESIDERTDIYGLGVVLYELLTGAVPHDAANPLQVAALALSAPIVPPSQLNPQVWPALERVVGRALARRPEDRFPSASAFRDAVEAAADPHAQSLPVRAARKVSRKVSRQDPQYDVAHQVTIPATSFVRGAMRAGRRQRAGGNRALLVAVTVLLTVTLCGSGYIAAVNASKLLRHTRATPTISPTVLATTSPNATLVPTWTPTASPTQMPTPTATPSPTAIPSPTATPTPLPLGFTPNPVQLIDVGGGECKGYQYITNDGGQALGWQWQSTSPELSSLLMWGINDPSVMQTSPPLPQEANLGSGQQETLYMQIPCSGQSYTVTASDSQGNSYSFALQSA